MTRTRREFFVTSSLFALLPTARAAESWITKKPAEWDPGDVQDILTHSAWAKPASPELSPTSLRAGAKKGHRVAAAQGLRDKRILTGFQVLVRWESGLPVRLARKLTTLPSETPARYALSMSGLPMAFMAALVGSGKPGHEEQDKAQIAEQVLHNSSLQRDDKPPFGAVHTDWEESEFEPRITVTFPRDNQPISLADKGITFVSQIGALVVRVRFSLKDMTYRGRLEL